MLRKLLISVVSLFISSGIFAQSSKIDSLEGVLNVAKDTLRVNILAALSEDYAYYDLDHADSIAQEALALSSRLGYQEGIIKSYNSLSYIKSSKGGYEKGYDLSQKALQLSEKLGNKALIAQSYHFLFVALFKKGEYKQALAAAEKSIAIAREINSIRSIAQENDDIGIIKGINGQHTEAIKYFMKSLNLYDSLDDQSKIATSLMHLGHTFELAGSLDEALKYLKRSLEVNHRVGNKYNEGWALVNIGVVYSRMSRFDTAISYYERSLKIGESIKDQRLILTNLDNIGGKYSIRKDFKKSNYYLRKAYDLSQRSGINSRTVYITGNLAENYLYMGKFDSAKIFGEQQLGLAINSDLVSEQQTAYSVLAQIYDSLGDHVSASKALQNYIAVNDTIFNRQKSEQIEQLREKYEADRKEQAIASLEKEQQAQRFRKNAFAGAALLILLIGGLLYNNQRIKNRKNKEMLKKELEVDQLKSKFFANITHEFRTPLTLILGPIEMMKSEAVNPKVHQHLDVMKMNASRLLDLINQLLELSKLESGSLKLKASRGNIVPVVKGVVMAFESIAQKKEIVLTTKSAKEDIQVCYDREKLEKVLINLLSNALKFTPEKGKIHVEISNTDQELEIHITDTGSGIPARDVGSVFNRFYQSDSAGKSTGTGIGLALAKELTELHHGSISVKSEEGIGSEFIIQLPMGDAHLSESEKAGMEVSEIQPDSHSSGLDSYGTTKEGNKVIVEDNGKPLLLLVEDNTDVRTYIEEILGTSYQLLMAKDGEEGIEMGIEAIPDIIVSDVMMPKKDGYEVCATLKQNEKTSHIPIILLTAKVAVEDKIQGLENQADDYVTKPFVPRELLARLQNLIDSRKKLREKFQRELVLKPSEIAVNSVDEQFIQKLLKIIEAHIGDEKFGVEQLADEVGMSRSQIHRKMMALTNQAPNQFIRTFRLTRAMELLKKDAATASEIAYQVGFSSPSYFTKCFRDEYGYPPGEVHSHV